MNISCDRLKEIYGESEESGKRYEALEKNFREIFKSDCTAFFSSPGRTEIVGNHTDHNGGRVIAGSISMDTIAAVAPNEDMVITIVSEGYPDKIVIEIDKLSDEKAGNGTRPLVAGILCGMREQGYELGGFDAYVSTNVIAASGVSSSATKIVPLIPVVSACSLVRSEPLYAPLFSVSYSLVSMISLMFLATSANPG